MRRAKSLWGRMALFFILSGTIPLMGAGAFGIWLIWQHVVMTLEERHLTLAKSIAFQVRETLKAHEVALAHMAGLLRQAGDHGPGLEYSLLRDHVEALNAQGVALEACALLDRDGDILGVYPRGAEIFGLDLSKRAEYKKAVETGEPQYSPVEIPLGFSEPMVTLALPLGSATVMGFISIAPLNNKIQALSSSRGETVLVLADQRGVAISHQDPLLVAQRVNLSHLAPISMALDSGDAKLRFQDENCAWIGAATRVPELGWPLAVMERESSALGFLKSTVAVFIVALASGVLLSLLLAFVLGARILRPIELFSRALKRISDGDYQGRLAPPNFTELQGLHRTFEKMVLEVQRREEALRLSEERYRLVVENAQDAILVAQDDRLKFVNPKMVELLQVPEEEIKARPFTDFIHPDDRALVLERHRRRLAGEKDLPNAYEFRIVNRSGEARWVEIRVLPVIWEERPAALAFLTDITERLERERALKESEERYRTLVENSPDGIFMAEIPSGRIIFVNRAICEMFRYSEEEALKLDFWHVLPHEERLKVQGILEEVLDGKPLPKEPLSIRAQRKDGTSLFIQVRVAFVQHGGRQVVQAMVRDVTEYELLQRQLQHSQRMQALGTLAGGVAHEFNNILAGIQGFAQLLAFTLEGNKDASKYLNEIISSCERAGFLTRRMLSMARVEAGEKCPLKVNHVVESTVRLLSQTLPPSVRIETATAAGLPFVMGDPTQLEQVLLNLGLNARDAMPDGGSMRIGTRITDIDIELCKRHSYLQPGRFIEMFVEDEGIGIPEDLTERIFEPFFTTKEAGKGTGLGLSVSYSIVKAHGGFIMAQSPPEGKERGSILRVLLPPVELGEKPRERGKARVTPPRGKGQRILVVDDETRIRQILEETLKKGGYQVECAENGQEAFVKYAEAMDRGVPFEAVVMDVAMPVRDGNWASARILEIDPGAKIIVATGHTDEKLVESSVRKRARALLRKPFDLGSLLETLGRILSGEREHQGGS
jgi:PAS domain S-box-containing protein